MSDSDELFSLLPFDQIAAELGTDEQTAMQASAAVLPALLGGLQANATDGGSTDLLQALGQHHDEDFLAGGVDLSAVDTADGAAIAQHIFGAREDEVVSQLGAMPLGAGGSLGGTLVRKLIPILAPIVLSYLAKQIFGRMGGAAGGGSAQGGSGSAGGGGLGDILGQILGGAAGGGSQGGSGGGGGLGDILGQVLGGGQSAPAPQQQSQPSQGSAGGPGSLDDLLQDVLGQAAGTANERAQQQLPQQSSGGGIMDILGQILGGGRR